MNNTEEKERERRSKRQEVKVITGGRGSREESSRNGAVRSRVKVRARDIVTSESVDTRKIGVGVLPSTGQTHTAHRSADDVLCQRRKYEKQARPAAIVTGTSVTIATATPDTRERCHNDKPFAARRYGAPEPGNRCERIAS